MQICRSFAAETGGSDKAALCTCTTPSAHQDVRDSVDRFREEALRSQVAKKKKKEKEKKSLRR